MLILLKELSSQESKMCFESLCPVACCCMNFCFSPATWRTTKLFPGFQTPKPRAPEDQYGGNPSYYKEGKQIFGFLHVFYLTAEQL